MASQAIFASVATVALVHTIVGVDHYLPFIVLSRAEGWSLRRTLMWTGICGLGHIASSIVLALLAGVLGWAIGDIRAVDGVRGDLAAYALLAFGIGYLIVALRRGHHHHHLAAEHSHAGLEPHTHDHAHEHGLEHQHEHGLEHHHEHGREHDHEHGLEHHHEPATRTAESAAPSARKTTLWALLIIFVLGPCEPLIPLLLAPALTHDLAAGLSVIMLFGGITLAAMLGMVALSYVGLRSLRLERFERWAHPLAGAAVALSGILILAGL